MSSHEVFLLAPAVIVSLFSLFERLAIEKGWLWMHRLGFKWCSMSESTAIVVPKTSALPEGGDLDLEVIWISPSHLTYRFAASSANMSVSSSGGSFARHGNWVMTGLLEVIRKPKGTAFRAAHRLRLSPLLFIFAAAWAAFFFGGGIEGLPESLIGLAVTTPVVLIYLAMIWSYGRKLETAYHVLTADLVRMGADAAQASSSNDAAQS